jgi:hypothetical protein
MGILFWGLTISVSAFLVHLAIWRVRLPKRQTQAMLWIFFIVWLAVTGGLWSHPDFSLLGVPAPQTWLQLAHVGLFVLAFTLAYMITYSALEADSPSIVMVMAVARAGSAGLPRSEFNRMMTDDVLVVPRVRDLLLDRMAYLEGDRYRLTPKGALFARIFIQYRKLLKTRKGG